jgi:hypothetical protein
MNNETIQPLEDFAACFKIDAEDAFSETGTFKRDSEGNYNLISVEFVVNHGFGYYTFEVDAEAIERHAPDHLARVEALMTERDPLRCTECRKLGPDCDCDGA